MSTKKGTKKSFEALLERLEEIVDLLEKGEASLDDAVDLYEEGMQLSKECAEKLKASELRIQKLTKTVNGEFELSPMDEE
ncbi:MAG: exodeoxyribonuclease VII small subunit [bacterium]